MKKPADVAKGIDFDRKLYIARRDLNRVMIILMFVSFLSSRTIVHKGMFLVGELRKFFLMICRMRIMNQPLQRYIHVLVRIRIQAGCVRIQTV